MFREVSVPSPFNALGKAEAVGVGREASFQLPAFEHLKVLQLVECGSSQGGRAVMVCMGSGDLPFKATGAELPGRHSSPLQSFGVFTAMPWDVHSALHCPQAPCGK